MMGKKKKQKMQTSETFLLSAVLAVSGEAFRMLIPTMCAGRSFPMHKPETWYS